MSDDAEHSFFPKSARPLSNPNPMASNHGRLVSRRGSAVPFCSPRQSKNTESCPSVNFVYRTNLHLPSEMFSPFILSDPFDATNLLHCSCQFLPTGSLYQLNKLSVLLLNPTSMAVPMLSSAATVFRRPPYNGPFEVLLRDEKTPPPSQINGRIEGLVKEGFPRIMS